VINGESGKNELVHKTGKQLHYVGGHIGLAETCLCEVLALNTTLSVYLKYHHDKALSTGRTPLLLCTVQLNLLTQWYSKL